MGKRKEFDREPFLEAVIASYEELCTKFLAKISELQRQLQEKETNEVDNA